MPRRRKPARLYQRPDDGSWIILDGGKQRRTGFGHGQHREAEDALAAYIAQRAPERIGPAQPGEITVGEILAAYLDGHGHEVAAPQRMIYAVKALLPFFADKTADSVKRATCKAYERHRAGVSSATVRRELGTLQAALNWSHEDGRLIHPLKVTLPEHGAPRDRWLTRKEAAALLKAADPMLRRFILIALATGRRREAIRALRWVEPLDGSAGWVDLSAGVIHFRGRREAETKKRRGSVRMPAHLAAHMRRWSRAGGSHVIPGSLSTFRRRWDDVAPEGVTPHTLKHTAVTWAFQGGMSREDAADYFDTTAATLDAVYRAHSPEHQGRAVGIMERRGR